MRDGGIPAEQAAAACATARQEDRADLAGAHKGADAGVGKKPWYKVVGPGLVTGAADDAPPGIGTCSANGARFGYVLLWLVPLCIPCCC